MVVYFLDMDAILPCCKFLQTLIVDKPLADPSFDNLLVAVALTVGLLWLSCVTLGLLKLACRLESPMIFQIV
jgi:hypothetical protein